MTNFKGKQVFKYEGELEKDLRLTLQAIQELTMEKVYNELIRYIGKRVYGKSPEEKDDPFYNRTKSLLYIWEIKDVYYHGGEYGGVYGGLSVNEDKFDEYIDNDKNGENRGWQHSSPVYPDISATDFVNIINNGVSAAHSLFGERPANPFWERFLEIMDERYADLFYETAKEYGLDLIDGNKYGAYYDIKGKNRRSTKNKDGSVNNPNSSVLTGVSRGMWTKV